MYKLDYMVDFLHSHQVKVEDPSDMVQKVAQKGCKIGEAREEAAGRSTDRQSTAIESESKAHDCCAPETPGLHARPCWRCPPLRAVRSHKLTKRGQRWGGGDSPSGTYAASPRFLTSSFLAGLCLRDIPAIVD